MKNETEMSETLKDNPQYLPLIPLTKFIKTGRAPVDMYHMIFYNKPSLEKSYLRSKVMHPRDFEAN